MTDRQKHTIWKKSLMLLASTGPASLIECVVMQPLDTIKTRFQLKPWWYNKGMVACARGMYRKEGFFSFWKGLAPVVIIDAPKKFVKFMSYKEYEAIFTSDKTGPDTGTYALAGLLAGVSEAVLTNPFEVVKVAQQMDHSQIKCARGSWTIAQTIYKSEGVRGFFTGGLTMVIRSGLYNMLYFGIYQSHRHWKPLENRSYEFIRQVTVAMLTGIFVTLVMYPADLVRTLFQKDWTCAQTCCWQQFRRYSIGDMMGSIVRREGFRALYKGLKVRLIRASVGSAIIMLSFQNCYDYLEENLK